MSTATMKKKRAAHRAKKRPSWESLQEYSAGGVGTVDREAGIIFNVRILGPSSMNGRRYTQQCVEDALDMYEGIVVNYDHPSSKDPDAVPPVSSRAGWLENVRVVNGGLSANLHLLKSDPRADKVFEAAETRPQLFGLSHNVEGRTRRADGIVIVDKIHRVRSVDIVSDPASTRSLFETGGKGENLAKAAAMLWGDYPGTGGLPCPTRLTEVAKAKKKRKRPPKKKGPANTLSEAIIAILDRKGVGRSTKMEGLRMLISGTSRAKSGSARQFAEAITGRPLREIVDEDVVDEEQSMGAEYRNSTTHGETDIGWSSEGFVADVQKIFDAGATGSELKKQLTDLVRYWISKLRGAEKDTEADTAKRQALGVKESRRRGGKSTTAADFYQKVTGESVPHRIIAESRGRLSKGRRSANAEAFARSITY